MEADSAPPRFPRTRVAGASVIDQWTLPMRLTKIVARIRDLERAEQIVEPERGHRVSQLD